MQVRRAVLLNKSVNFPQHEGQDQAAKKRKDRIQGARRDEAIQVRGVTWNKKEKKWKARIKIDGKDKHLGYFDDEKEAAARRRASRPPRQAREPSQHEGQEQEEASAASEGSVQGARRDEAIQVRGSDLAQAEEEVESRDHDRWQEEEPGCFDDEKEAACKYDEQPPPQQA